MNQVQFINLTLAHVGECVCVTKITRMFVLDNKISVKEKSDKMSINNKY